MPSGTLQLQVAEPSRSEVQVEFQSRHSKPAERLNFAKVNVSPLGTGVVAKVGVAEGELLRRVELGDEPGRG